MRKQKKHFLAHWLVSAMPTWEVSNLPLGLLATDGVPGPVKQIAAHVNNEHDYPFI